MISRLGAIRLHTAAILVSGLMITGIGVMTIFATEAQSELSYTKRQLLFTLVGLGAIWVVNQINYQRIGRWSYLCFGVMLILLIPLIVAKYVPLTPLIPLRNGAHRWYRFPGYTFQPSEFMKIAYILSLAWYLRYRRNYRTLRGLVGPFVLTVIPMLLILLQPDLGTVLLFMPMLFTMLFVAGARMKHFLVLMLLAGICAPGFWLIMPSYQKRRVVAVLLQSDALRSAVLDKDNSGRWSWLCSRKEAAQWEYDYGYQLVHSKAALGSGGLFGQPWAVGTYVKYDILPDKHNDFIFAVIGHQFGFIGCVTVFALFGVIIVTGFDIAASTNDPFGRLVAVGATTLLATQVVINAGVTMGLMPTTGMTLPLASSGGSSLLTSYLLLGLLVNVAQRRPVMLSRKPFTFNKDVPNVDPRTSGLAGVG